MMKTNFKKIAVDGVITQNPTLKLVLGTCPTLALTTLAMNGIGMASFSFEKGYSKRSSYTCFRAYYSNLRYYS